MVTGFSERFGLTSLVYFEVTESVESAIAREKEIKGWVRRKKTALIHSLNPEWKDLSAEWMEPSLPDTLRCTQGDKREVGDKGASSPRHSERTQ